MQSFNMNFIQFILILNGVYFTSAVELNESKDIEIIKEHLHALTERFAEIEQQNLKLQEKTTKLETALLKQKDLCVKAEKWYTAQIEDLQDLLSDGKSWNEKAEKILTRNSGSFMDLRKAFPHIDGVTTSKRQSGHEDPVAFYAGLSNDVTYGYGDSFLFDNVTLNQGFHYMPSFGLFRAPYNGIYVFSTTLMTQSRTDTHAAIYVNDQPKTWMKLYGSEHEYDTISQTAIYHLNQGDAVAIKHTESNKSFHGQYTYFSGFLLQEMFTSTNIVGK